ncbi:hypothetical protein BRARA_E02146 [Brassica rapa]|uniref:Ubiquitin carboxyl-terminal hydrolase 14 n=1 Tax=Brassica campestris TaxID=3711 RepID=A0A397ZIH7_BRACM|nr:hypothetical protein BRARA_E02146 [Brassica rapa]
MELLRSNLSRVQIPEPTHRIYKHECCLSFDTPRSEGGLFVDMNSFLAFGKDYVAWNHEKTGNPVYLHIKDTPKSVPEDRPLKKPTLLAIGVDGGFDNNETEYEESYSIVILPDFVSLPFPSVELPEKVRIAVDTVLSAVGAERREQVAAWTAEEKKASEHALTVQQLKSGVVIPPSGWKCAKCDKKENLWLNLTDGMILCGRKNWDGTGGNNHAVEHYKETSYPLAVKLGTITADLEAADVYSYPEDDSVLDPLLAQHLAHFGIDFSSMQKVRLQPGEELLPDAVPEEVMETAQPVANEEIVAQLVSMGFNQLHCQKAAINTSNVGVEEATNWLFSHMDDPDIDAPISHQASDVDQSSVDTLISFGFAEEVARKALKASGGDIEKATDWIFNNPNASVSDMDVSSSSSAQTPAQTGLPDGGGRYKLFGIVSHMGTSTHCGHYVAHILKEGRWVIFNDSKVGISTDPPKDMGYLYFFQRLEN